MIAAFFEYVRNVAFYLVFIAFVGVLLPGGNYKKYLNLVLGIIMIGVLLAPLMQLIRFEPTPVTDWFAQLMPHVSASDDAQNTMANWQHEQIRAQFHAQLHEQTAVLLPRQGFTLLESSWETTSDFRLTGVRLTVTPLSYTTTEVERRPFIRVEPVQPIQILNRNTDEAEPDYPDEEEAMALPIKMWLADFYNIPLANIYVNVVKNGG